MKHIKRTHPTSVRLLMTLLPLLTVIFTLFGIFCNTLYQDKLEQELTYQLQLQVDAIAYQLDNTLTESNRLSTLVYSNTRIRKGLEAALGDQFTQQDRFTLYQDVTYPLLSTISSPGRYTIELYPLSPKVFTDHLYIFQQRYFPDAEVMQSLLSDTYSKTLYHVGQKPYYYNSDFLYAYNGEGLYISRAMYSAGKQPLAIVSAVTSMDHLRSIVRKITPDDQPFCYSVSLPDNSLLFGEGTWLPDMLTVSSRVSTGNLMLKIGFAPAIIAEQTRAQTRMLIMAGLLMLLIAAIMIFVICWMVMKSLHDVVRKFRRLQVGAPLVEEPRAGQDEAALIDQTFTSVYRKYYKSVRDQEVLEANQKRLESALLLSKINPHFLYNTLSALRWSMPEEDRHIIDRLVAYYRSVLGQGRDLTSLSSEKELIGQYIDLQRYTYSKHITLRCDISDELSMLILPKFLLQPIVENAVKTCSPDEMLTVSLSAHREGNALILCIENDGPPISEEIMHHLNALNDCDQPQLLKTIPNPEEPRGYGVFNVIMRIRLTCGAGYGLWHERPACGGTRARYILPATRDAEDYMPHRQDG